MLNLSKEEFSDIFDSHCFAVWRDVEDWDNLDYKKSSPTFLFKCNKCKLKFSIYDSMFKKDIFLDIKNTLGSLINLAALSDVRYIFEDCDYNVHKFRSLLR